MDIQWQGSIGIAAHAQKIYAYLADFTRHTEWTQTVARIRLHKPGDAAGVGAEYMTAEAQAMRSDRAPDQPVPKGLPATTLCIVTELVTDQRIGWKARMVPNTGMHARYLISLTPQPGGATQLAQTAQLHIPAAMAAMFKLMYGRDIEKKATSQFAAGLRNIKTIVERAPR